MPTILLGGRRDWREILTTKHARLTAPPPKKKKHFWKRARTVAAPEPIGTRPKITFLEKEFSRDTVRESEFDFILPFSMEDYAILRDCPQVRHKCIFPEEHIAKAIDDKIVFNALMMECGYANCIPRVGSPSELELPFIQKRRVDEYGIHTRIITKRSETDRIHDPDFYFQEYVPGAEEYATHAICVAGRLVYVKTYKYLFNSDTYTKSAQNHPFCVEDLGGYIPSELASIFADLSYTGCACFNFKLKDETPMIFELNPRVGASFARNYEPYLWAYMRAVQDNNRRAANPDVSRPGLNRASLTEIAARQSQ
ncbi:hypothetical protein [Hyphomicrobium sp. MC8b]|uniref:hypothetical protein n=1 Tax=Hyphomicrobium sp. MC8b TaxID=300273 RepID=UPI003919E666